MKLMGRRVLIDVPQRKESVIELTAKDEEQIMKEAMKLWTKLTVYAVGDTVEKYKAGDVVYITTDSLQNAEKVELEDGMKLMVSEGDIAITW
jgi:ribonuclease BN (tRNA processing enzyme)